MRVLATILLIAIVCQGAFAVTSKTTQAKLMIEKINNQLEKSHLGRALKNMVTIATKLGYNYDDLYTAFDALKNSLSNMLYAEEELFSVQSAAHVTAVAQYEADISKYSAEIVDGEALLASLNASLSNYQSLLASAQAALAQDKADKQNAEEQLAQLEEVYRTESEEYANVRLVIREAVEKLNEAQQHYDAADVAGFSFVQLKNTFVSFAQKISSATEKLPSKHQLFVKPVIQAMMQVKSTTEQSAIQNAINALNDLQSYFDKALSDLTALYISFKASLEETIASLAASIDLLENQVIPGYENEIHLLETSIAQTEEALALSRANLEAAQEALAAENEAYAHIEARHNALVSRLNFEYDLVGQAERFIRHAQANLEA